MLLTSVHVEVANSALKGVRKFDRLTGRDDEYIYPSHLWPDEHIFIPEKMDSEEDRGWLVGFVYSQLDDSSRFSIIDAQNLSAGPVATI